MAWQTVTPTCTCNSLQLLMVLVWCFGVQVITKLLYLLHQGETFTKVRARVC